MTVELDEMHVDEMYLGAELPELLLLPVFPLLIKEELHTVDLRECQRRPLPGRQPAAESCGSWRATPRVLARTHCGACVRGSLHALGACISAVLLVDPARRRALRRP